MLIAENIAKLEERIQKACDSAGRSRNEITLMGITKFVPVKKIKEAFCCGIYCFGESRVKEAAEKLAVFREEHSGTRIDLVGSLQRNKAKQAAVFFDCIQSVDRDELILDLIKHSALRDKPLSVLLELHTGEETKSGFAANSGSDFDSLYRAAELILSCSNLKPAGLMTMAPFTTDEELIRSSFRQLVKAQKELKKRFPTASPAVEGAENWSVLSMGMSNDFEIAIEEGSNLLRVGSAIFKEQ